MMTYDYTNPVLFLVDCMRAVAGVLNSYTFLSVPIWTWFIGFIFVGMAVSVFWRGARG